MKDEERFHGPRTLWRGASLTLILDQSLKQLVVELKLMSELRQEYRSSGHVLWISFTPEVCKGDIL